MPETKSIAGSNEITFKAVAVSKVLQFDLFKQYNILGITMNDDTLSYTRDSNSIYITLNEELVIGRKLVGVEQPENESASRIDDDCAEAKESEKQGNGFSQQDNEASLIEFG